MSSDQKLPGELSDDCKVFQQMQIDNNGFTVKLEIRLQFLNSVEDGSFVIYKNRNFGSIVAEEISLFKSNDQNFKEIKDVKEK